MVAPASPHRLRVHLSKSSDRTNMAAAAFVHRSWAGDFPEMERDDACIEEAAAAAMLTIGDPTFIDGSSAEATSFLERVLP